MNKAIFLDRDGVLIEDVNLLKDYQDIRVYPYVPPALRCLKDAGFLLIVVSNQTVIARGLLNEEQTLDIQREIERRIEAAGGPALDGFYFCPHHPNATLKHYLQDCDCRKPRPGMILRAAEEFDIDLQGSILIGDRFTDIIAGKRAGCRTVLVETGAHAAPLIQTAEPLDLTIRADFTCADLAAAARFILEGL